MAKMFDYPDKVFTEVSPDLDYLIITNGAEEYNITVTELFKVHLQVTSHDHSQFTIESDVREFARQEATPIANSAVAAHENTFDHAEFIDSLEAGNIADTHIAAYFPLNTSNLQNGDALIYNSSNARWENGTISGGAEYLNDLNDVDFSIAPTQFNEIITFNNEHGVWENSPFNFELIWDVQFDQGQLSEGQPLIYNANGDFWTNLTAGFNGTFKDYDQNIVTVENGLIVSVEAPEPPEVWYNYTQDPGITGQSGTTYYDDGNGTSGWAFTELS